MYVFAPIKTAPQEIAVSIFAGIIPTDVATPSVNPIAPAVVKNTRYVGVLSKKLESPPVVQNIWNGSVISRLLPIDLKISRAGCIVMKIPTNKTATSWIASQVK